MRSRLTGATMIVVWGISAVAACGQSAPAEPASKVEMKQAALKERLDALRRSMSRLIERLRTESPRHAARLRMALDVFEGRLTLESAERALANLRDDKALMAIAEGRNVAESLDAVLAILVASAEPDAGERSEAAKLGELVKDLAQLRQEQAGVRDDTARRNELRDGGLDALIRRLEELKREQEEIRRQFEEVGAPDETGK